MKLDSKWDVVVIGGGAAGLMCAAVAAGRGRKVLLLEKNSFLRRSAPVMVLSGAHQGWW